MKRLMMMILLGGVGCGTETFFPTVLAEPVELDGALFYLDSGQSSAVIVDPEGRAGPNRNRSLFRLPLGDFSVRALSTPRPDAPDRRQVLVVDAGSQSLFVVRDRSGGVDAIDVGLPVEEVAVAPGGRYAVAFQGDGGVVQQSLFSFPNAVAVIDLAPGSPRASTFELGAGGARPIAVEFSEPFEIEFEGANGPDIAELQVALVFVQGGIVPLDLLRGESGPFVPLGNGSDERPETVAFSNNRGDDRAGALDTIERAYVQTSSGELFVLAVSAVRTSSGVAPLVALENVVTPDRFVYDFELFFSDDGRDLLLASLGTQVVLVDGYTGVAERFDVPSRVESLRAYDDPDSAQRLGLGFDAGRRELYRFDPFALDRRRASGIEVIPLGAAIADVEVSQSARRAILTYEGERELGVLDLSSDGGLVDLRFATSIAAMELEPERLLVVGNDPLDFEPMLAAVRLEGGLGSDDVNLRSNARAVGATERYVWVDRFDSVTFFPHDQLTTEAAIHFDGIAFSQILNVPIEGDDS